MHWFNSKSFAFGTFRCRTLRCFLAVHLCTARFATRVLLELYSNVKLLKNIQRSIFLSIVLATIIVAPAYAMVKNPIGFNVHAQMRFSDSEWTSIGELFQENKLHWAREEFNWNTIQPEEGTFNFEQYDNLVEEYRKHDVRVLGLLTYSSSWASTQAGEDGYEFAPPNMDAWETYVRTVAERYADDIQYWEIWNEPNTSFFWTGDRETYAQLLRTAYVAIKEVNPNAKIVSGGTAGADSEFFRDLCTLLDGKKGFDIAGVHPYRQLNGAFSYAPETSKDGLNNLLIDLYGVRRAVESCWGQTTSIWITEFGYPTSEAGDFGVTQKQQNDYLRRSIVQALTVPGVKKVFVYELRDSGDDTQNQEHHFGVLNRDFTQKLSFLPLAKLNRQLHRTHSRSVYKPHLLKEVSSTVGDWSITVAENSRASFRDFDDLNQEVSSTIIDYTFESQENSYIEILAPFPEGEQKNMLAFWVKGSEGPEVLRLRVEDAGKEVHQYTLGTPPQQFIPLYVRLRADASTYWNGDGNGVVDFPIQKVSFILDDHDSHPTADGTVTILDLQFIGHSSFYSYRVIKKKPVQVFFIQWGVGENTTPFRVTKES